MSLVKKTKTVTLNSAGAGVSLVDDTVEFGGVSLLYAVRVTYLTTNPATTDLTISNDAWAAGVASADLVKANSNTNTLYYPRAAAVKSADASASTLSEVLPLIDTGLRIQVAQGNSADQIQLDFYFQV